MRDKPAGMAEGDLRLALADGWRIQAAALRDAPVGGGSYHWEVRDRAARRWFVTVDDLDDKPWLGTTRGGRPGRPGAGPVRLGHRPPATGHRPPATGHRPILSCWSSTGCAGRWMTCRPSQPGCAARTRGPRAPRGPGGTR